MIGKKLRKIIAIALNILYAKKEKYILLMFQSLNQNVKNKLFQMEKNGIICSKKANNVFKRNKYNSKILVIISIKNLIKRHLLFM